MNYLRLSNLFAVPLMEFNYGEISDTAVSYTHLRAHET